VRLRGPTAWSIQAGPRSGTGDTVEVTVGCRDCGWEDRLDLGPDRGKATERAVETARTVARNLFEAHACGGRKA
jgi:hypothetical protein